MPCSSMFSCGAATAVSMGRRARRPSRPEAAILVILENTSGTGWLLLTIAHEERRSAPIRERRYEPWRFEWGSDRLLEPEFFGHCVRDRHSGDGTTGVWGLS